VPHVPARVGPRARATAPHALPECHVPEPPGAAPMSQTVRRRARPLRRADVGPLVCWTCRTWWDSAIAYAWRTRPLRPGERCRDTSWSGGAIRCRGRLARAPRGAALP
jgi:hypothetical protein